MRRNRRRKPIFIGQKDLYDMSRSNAQLAKDLGISEKSVWRQRVRAGLHTPSRRAIDTCAVVAMASKSDGEIAAALGVTPQGVNKARRRMGIKPAFRRGSQR